VLAERISLLFLHYNFSSSRIPAIFPIYQLVFRMA
jgi:hypothetical protein